LLQDVDLAPKMFAKGKPKFSRTVSKEKKQLPAFSKGYKGG
jgi:hypothetical protein